ncbi:SpvB/TcaC N-terminal domain-containing protein [Amycolatopsis keratiniphila]|uniref:SpvB/TcaC N-terminal domain-containing protein n=1 Tax=Amycolatopsis keratiniphila TaxID=129921 RepID=UPI00087C3132|nr:SpvB/TcaC N-terminal domain-containing protein [Amycolatopsis keratiniphila]SDU25743.1 RHS repeat-associated core domain-containing protein [Amycolatopsis keratiniphila]
MSAFAWARPVRHRHKAMVVALFLVLVAMAVPSAGPPASVRASGEAGALTAPEHPEGTAFDPNQLKDIKAADPGAGVNLIGPPAANAMGDARLSYPLEVPKGRAGLEPKLEVRYASGGANGWLGVGWDVALPSITVDTRWGVPRYDAGLETETYVLNGEQLTPVAHRGELQKRAAEKVFHARVESRFDRIVRHGDNPAGYWWEVTDKAGTRMLFGGTADTTLTDKAGRVATWAVREVRDTHDNVMRYRHAKVNDGGTAESKVPGGNLYPQRITYTGHGDTEGKYSVTFLRDRDLGEPRRADVQIDARGGFKKVTADLLRRVEVKLDDQLVRAYGLNYRTGAFAKTLLASISQFGEDNRLFATHSMDYFDDVRDKDGNYHGFAEAAKWTVGDDDLGVNVREGEASALSASTSVSAGGHLYTGYNPVAPIKSGSAGVKIGANAGVSDGLLALADVNGDNLPDKVFRKGGEVWYRPNLAGPGGQPRFGDTALKLPGLPAISSESTLSGTIGVEAFAGVAAQLDLVSTITTSDRYFSDVNGDGITDLVNNGGVLFGYLDAGGQPAYSEDSRMTSVPVGGGVASGEFVGDQRAAFDRAVDTAPLLDSVRRWVAPYDGTVRVDGRVRLERDTSPQRAAYQKADGVRVTIQHKGTELWAQRIGPDDHMEFAPTGVSAIGVRKGDAIYFRTQSILDGMYDTVAWDPTITYAGGASTDVNGLSNSVYSASKDFTLSGRQSQVTAPVTGTLKLTGDVVKDKVTSDEVSVVITRNGKDVVNTKLPAASTGTTPIDLSIPVTAKDSLSWRLRADSAIDPSALKWVPQAHYTQAEGVETVVDENGKPTIVINPPYDLDMYPVSSGSTPQKAWTAGQTGQLFVQPFISPMMMDTDKHTFVFTIKKRGGQLLGKQVIEIPGGLTPKPTPPRMTVQVTQGDELFFDFATQEEKAPALMSASAMVGFNPFFLPQVSATVSASAKPGAFAQPYRGWGVIGYQAQGDRATKPIVESDLVLDESFRDSLPKAPKEEDVPGFKADPKVTMPRLAVLVPMPAEGRWAGADKNTWVGPGTTASSRYGTDTIDVVSDADVAGAKGVPRRGMTVQVSTTLGAGPVGGSLAGGLTAGGVDFLDLNGDRFPDVVGSSGIQYSDMTGGLGGTRGSLNGTVRDANSVAVSVSAGAGSPARTMGTARGTDAPEADAASTTARAGLEMPALGIGGSVGGGESATLRDLLDINGDGLPDKVHADGKVALNLGYSFAEPEPWPAGAVNTAQTGNVGVNLGVNLDNYGFAGGVSATLGATTTKAGMADVNGDGLADRVFAGAGGQPISVAVNTGSGFAAPAPFRGGFSEVAVDKNANLAGGAYFTFGFPMPFGGFLVFNPGVDASTGIGRSEVGLRDVNGDGLADHVKSARDNELLVASNQTGRTNLLRSMTRPMGGRVDLDYTRVGNTQAMPESRWVLSRTTVSDGHPGDGADTQLTTYRYELGKYDRLEREFHGFGKVVTEQRDPGAADALYRSTTEEYRTDGPYTAGLPARTLTADGAGRPLTETVNTYQLRDTADGGGPAKPASAFPQLTRVDKHFYEGAAKPGKSTHVEMTYDEYGNLTRSFDAADDGGADDVETTYGYSASDPACRDRNIVGVTNLVKQRGTAGDAVTRHSESTVDCRSGAMRQIRQYLTDSVSADTDMEYYPDGNLKSVTKPANRAGQRYRLEYGYDTVVGVHIESIVDSFGLRSGTTHNLKYGQPERTTDQNGQQVLRGYDSVGRLDTVTGPYEIGSGKVTIDFDYHPEAAVPYATTRHLDRDAAGVREDTIDTVTFADGLKRVLQTKKDATVAERPGDEPEQVMTVSGRTKFDFAGRAVERYHPVTEPKAGDNSTFNAAFDTVTPTRVSFDALDRPVKTVEPDEVTSTTTYGFGPDRAGATRFETTVTDGNGKQKRTYQDVRELTTAVKEFNPAGGQPVIWTGYGHDPFGQLITVVDDKNNTTRSEYDTLGRRTVLDSPDAGRTETRYDLAGNTTAKTTANLKAAAKQVEYDYDHNRLKAVRYPTFPANNVTYTHGGPGAPDNAAGRVTEIRDAAGTVTRGFGPLGETVRETRTVKIAGQADRAYTTQWRFDAFNRVLQMTYPDTEVLTYTYDSGGQVVRATGTKNGTGYTYLNRLDYDKFGQKVVQEAGNGVRTTYTYDQADRRLATLKSKAPGGTEFQNLGYTYDKVGNITKLANEAPGNGTIGGPSSQTYGYDDLYRLTSANGQYTTKNDQQDKYSLALGYDSVHNTMTKTQHHEITGVPAPAGVEKASLNQGAASPVGGGGGSPASSGPMWSGPIEPVEDPVNPAEVQDKTSYDYRYEYGSGKPHAPSKVGPITQAYDANGNLTDTVNTAADGKRRQYVWDEENRLACNSDDATTAVPQTPAGCTGTAVTYTYDAAGERVIKNGDGQSLYPNRGYSERDGKGYKHIFIGDNRLVTKTVAAEGVENTQSFFHADHLGSSGYVTDNQGTVTEHLEYMPFGETWVEENAGRGGTPYKYTGKELDEETGLYYHGARYYNPRTQLWAGADPALAEFMAGSKTAGGITDSRNLALYTYTHNNPVILTDPDGREPRPAMPSPPPPPTATNHEKANKDGSGPDDYDTWEPSLLEKSTLQTIRAQALLGAGATGQTTLVIAADMLTHFLGNSGSDYTVDVDKMLKQIDGFQSEVERVALEAAMKVWSGFPSGHRESFAFETGYSNNYRADYKSNPDWLAALGWFDFQISGVVTPTSDGGYDITYQVSIYDYYNWESTGWRPWRQASDLNDLHRAGWAQNFDVIGRSSPRTFHVPPS